MRSLSRRRGERGEGLLQIANCKGSERASRNGRNDAKEWEGLTSFRSSAGLHTAAGQGEWQNAPIAREGASLLAGVWVKEVHTVAGRLATANETRKETFRDTKGREGVRSEL